LPNIENWNRKGGLEKIEEDSPKNKRIMITVKPLENLDSPTQKKRHDLLGDKKVMSFVESPDAHLVDEELNREELRI